ncbi:MAG: hypothetical protein AMJ54_13120, partial [Deltaproteobacteria bacterium SG8_13]
MNLSGLWFSDNPGCGKSMQISKGQVLDLDITGIAFGGRGLAHVDGLAVFVDQVTPMDRARVRIVRKRKR